MSSGLMLDGIDDCVRVNDSDALDFGASDSFAVSLWVRTNAAAQEIMSKLSGAGWRVFLDASGRVNFELSDGTNTATATGTSNIADGEWHLIEADVDRQNAVIKLFVDGNAESSHACGVVGSVASTADLVIGVDSGGTDYFSGAVAEVRVSSAVRHTADYTPSLQQYSDDADTVLLLHFNEGQGTKAYDMSLERNDGTLSGNPQWIEGAVTASPMTIVREYVWRAIDVDERLSAYCESRGVKKYRMRAGDAIVPEDLSVDLMPALMVLPWKARDVRLETVAYHALSLPVRICGRVVSAEPREVEYFWHLVLSALFGSWRIEGGVLGCAAINSFRSDETEFLVQRSRARNALVTGFDEVVVFEYRHRYVG